MSEHDIREKLRELLKSAASMQEVKAEAEKAIKADKEQIRGLLYELGTEKHTSADGITATLYMQNSRSADYDLLRELLGDDYDRAVKVKATEALRVK